MPVWDKEYEGKSVREIGQLDREECAPLNGERELWAEGLCKEQAELTWRWA